ncbi:flavocytochrome c [Paenibacillus macerans]|uniref:flavocytochrome c n=1 Tax=Paenibacillus macerans TaxID=44252 RepID=UPI00068B8697|nr:flavocytochrome c [Paenibacillus macerans]MEC0148996.1 flavocytochrome c [Paenibacillus macerans]GBK66251.1 flavocytochrome c [Paenibacillus macerans]GBK72608.1 flavocytochrome c [Paenibacillus macerans]SUA86288.1 oxidoreductase [Paenibacillus macerans]
MRHPSCRYVRTGFLAALVFILIIGVIGCSGSNKEAAPDAAEPQGIYTPGTYTGEAQGLHSVIKVEVTVDANTIQAVKVLEQKDTEGVSDAVFETIPQKVVEGQSLKVDIVSGASVSSNGLIDAIAAALAKAGADIDALKSKEPLKAAAKEAITKETEVVVVGGGGAGLAAAVSAAENGAKVILIEKSPALGGNTIRSGGEFNSYDPARQPKVAMTKALSNELKEILTYDEKEFGDYADTLKTLKEQIKEYFAKGDTTKLFDSPELHMIHTYIGGKRTDLDGKEISGKFELVKTLATNSYGTIQWLESHGAKFQDGIGTVLGALWPRTHHNTEPLGTGYINAMEKSAKELGAEIMLNTKATKLIVENGRIVGVTAEQSDGTPVTLKASKGVVMATGGFGANPEMVVEYNNYWPALDANIKTTNTTNATGDGIVMGKEVGANLWGMGFIQLMPSGQPGTGALSGGVWGSAETQIFVNKEGKRYVNEYAERDVLAAAALEQTDQTFYIISDMTSLGNPDLNGKNVWGDNYQDLIANKNIFMADTLEELAEQMGVPADVFVAEMKKYNTYVENQLDPEFGKKNFGAKLETPPFFAAPRTPSVHHTMGGLEINEKAQVLNTEGKPIDGLFAAGEVAGGVHAGNRLGGNAITDIFTFGRIAGASAAGK